MNLTKYICDLLYRHDCVIIPDFGGFLCQRSSAVLDTNDHTLIPPKKVLIFNIELGNNDGLLVHQIAQGEKFGYEQALQCVHTTVDQWKKELADQRRLSMAGIGRFEMSSEDQLIFYPDTQANFLTEAFGLHQIRVSPILLEARPKKWQWVRYAAAVALPLAVGYGAYFTHLQGTQKNPFDALSSILPMISFSHYEKPVDRPWPEITLIEPVESLDHTIVEPIAEVVVEKESESVEANKFWLIAGVFQSDRRAQNLLKQLRREGYKKAKIYQEGRKTYVAYDTFFTEKDARNQLNQIDVPVENDQPWIKVVH